MSEEKIIETETGKKQRRIKKIDKGFVIWQDNLKGLK